MKKIKGFVVSMLLAIVCLFTMIACGNNVAGMYKTVSVRIGETTVSVGEKFPNAREPVNAEFFVLELKDDNSAIVTITDGETVQLEGTWEKGSEAKTIVVTCVADGEEMKLTCKQDGKNLIIDVMGEYEVTLAK